MGHKILYLASSTGLTLDQSGGAGTHIRGAIGGFKQHGCEVFPLIAGDLMETAIPSHNPSKLTTTTSIVPVRNFFKGMLPNKIRLLLRDIRTIWQDYQFEKLSINSVRNFKPDAIYERASYLSMYGSRMAKKFNVLHFYETDGCMVEIINKDYGVFSTSIGNMIETRKLKQADYIVVMNKLTIPEVIKKFKLTDKKFLVKPLGVEIGDFKYNAVHVDELKHQFKIGYKFVVGFVGAISTYHGVNYLIECAKYLNKDYSDNIVIVIVGWSKEGDILKRRVEEYGLHNVIFTGKVHKSEVADYYEVFNVGVIPDSEETMYPIKVLEYGAFSICPLVPEYPVFTDIISENKNGYFFRPKDPYSLFEAIVRMYKEREQCAVYGKNWSDFVKGNFRWKDSVSPIVKALN